MREIKFRAWDKLNEEMCYFDLKKYMQVNEESQDEMCPPDNGTMKALMQYTGLKDKNDKEIYEGDILKVFDTDKSHQVQEVVFKDGAFCGFSENKSCRWTLVDVLIRANGVEVIGNIYE